MKKWAAGLLLLALLQGTGVFPGGKEMEELTLITALAVDEAEGEIQVTAVTGTRQSQGEEAELLTGQGKRLSVACRNMELSRPTRAYLGQTRQVLLGEKAVQNHWGGVFDGMLSGGPLRLDSLIYIVRGRAGEGLAASMDLTSEGGTAETIRGKTAGEILSRLSEGEWVLIPILSCEETESLKPVGWAVAGPTGMEQQLEGDAALGAELLSGLGKGEVVSFPHGSMELKGVRIHVVGKKLFCDLSGKRTEGQISKEEVELWAETCIRTALAQSGGRDCWSLGRSQRAWGKQPTPLSELTIRVRGNVVE